jgi:plasmid stabilization system protein ParE
MAYHVRLTGRSQKDLRAIYEYIKADRSDKAFAWYLRLKEGILTLRELPDRCPITPENSGLRALLFGKRPHVYRVI